MTASERARLKRAVDQAQRQRIYRQNTRTCPCGAPFHPVNHQRYCTKRCANRNHYDRTRQR